MSKQIKTIVYYNNFNLGDLSVVRSLIRYVIKTFPQYTHKLRHAHGEKVLRDLQIPVYWKPVENKFDLRGYYTEYGILNFNVHVLCHNRMFFNRYSFTMPLFYNIFAKTLWEVFKHDILCQNIFNFLPCADYMFYDIQNIDNLKMKEKNVLVCNNKPQSEQSTNFDMNILLHDMAIRYPSVDFYVTNTSDVKGDNIIYVKDIIGDVGNDLNEIAYLSKKCDVLIGRYSGPHTFTYIRENLLNTKKTFVTFSPPSMLYGLDPEKWADFGMHAISSDDEHAKFFNIPENDDNIRKIKIFDILEKNL